MLMMQERQSIVKFGKQISEKNLSGGTSGNLSCYDPQTGHMAISPSGVDYRSTTPEDIVIMDLDGHIIEGGRKPSSEYALHAAMYRCRPEARGVVHVHSTYCTTFACLRQPLKAVHYAISGAVTDEVPCAEYAAFGTPELAENAARCIGDSRAVLLANHGLIASGTSLERAFALAVNLEFAAELQWRAMCVGTPVILSGQEMEQVRAQMRSYGQKRDDSAPKDTVGY